MKDCGIGILPELHKKVFEPYYQITRPKKSVQGMGLGLPIVKKVVESLNGEIQIKSSPKKSKGTLVEVILNKYALAEKDVIVANPTNNNIIETVEKLSYKEILFDECKETILIVEDNIIMVDYLLRKLRCKYNVYTALNGNDALRKIKNVKAKPDLIISDIMMDKLDGYAFAKIISNSPAYNHIPIVFLSAKSSPIDRLLGLKSGAIDFIQKPFSIQELTLKIESILSCKHNQNKAFLSMALHHIGIPENFDYRTTNRFEQNCELYNLTQREKEIAKLLREGCRYKEIGEKLFIAEKTVTKHVQNIFEKLDVSNRMELVNKLASDM